MAMPAKEQEYTDKVRRFLKAELKRADVSYGELARRLNEHGLSETEVGIASKLARGTFSATFLLACLVVLGIAAIALSDI